MKKLLILLGCLFVFSCDDDGNDDYVIECDYNLDCGDTVELFGNIYDVGLTTHIDFEYGNLTGEIPPEIGCLVNLEWLDLEENQLTGEIPQEIANLVNLEYFDLEDNELSGSVPDCVRELILNINTLCGSYTSLIGNQLIDNDWINQNACGDADGCPSDECSD